MPWQVPITVDGLEYPVTFNTEGEPTQQDYDEAVQQILSQKAQAAPEPEPETPGYLSQLGSALGLGYRQMKSGVGATFNALTGDTADVAAEMAEMSKLQREQQAAQTPEDMEFMRSLEEAEKGFEQAQGPLESIGALAQYPAAVFAQPGAAFKTAVQSAPNALISGATSLAGYGLGGLVGGVAGIETGPGAILTGLAGATAGGALSNTLMEAGPSIFDVLNERTQGAASNMTADEIAAYLQQNPDIVEEGLKTGAIRGSVIGAVEALGVKGSGRLLTMPERAAARAVQKELMAQGVDVASKEAVDKALLDPALRASTKAVAETAKNQFSSAGNMARLAGASAIETGAAGAGELAAQAAAGQDISTKEAFLEMMGDAALSLPMAATTKAFEGAKYMLNPALVSDLGKASAENLAATGSTAAAEAQEGFNEAIELAMLPFTREDIRATEMPFTREDIRATDLPFTREDIRATQLPFGREDIRATEMPFSREDIRGISTPAPAVEEVGDEVEPLSEGAERNRAVIAEAAAKLRGEAPQDISAGLQAAIPQQPVETQEDAIQEQIPDEGVLRQERPEMELPGVGEQNAQPEEAATEGEEVDRPDVTFLEEIPEFTSNAFKYGVPGVGTSEGFLSYDDVYVIDPKKLPPNSIVGSDFQSYIYPSKGGWVEVFIDLDGVVKATSPLREEFLSAISTPPAEPTTATEGKVTPGGVATERDATKPEQMTPKEKALAGIDELENQATRNGTRPLDTRWEAKAVQTYKMSHRFNFLKQEQTGKAVAAKIAVGKAKTFAALREALQKLDNETGVVEIDRSERIPPSQLSPQQYAKDNWAATHEKYIEGSLRGNEPVNAAAVDSYGITLPEGYVKQGDLYIFQPQTKQAAEKQTPVPLREGTGAAGFVQSEPVEGSIPTVEKVSPETESESSEKLDPKLVEAEKKQAKEEEAAAKKQEKLEQDTKSSLNSVVGPQKKNDIQGTVTKADVEAARAALTNSGEIPNAYLTNVYESREAFLADRMNSRLFPASYARLQTEKNIEGLFENGQTLVFAKEVQVSDLDRGLAKMLGVSDEQAAARRVIAHENGHRAISLFTMAEKRELRGYLMRAYSDEKVENLVKTYTEYADWRTNPESRLEALEELLMRDFERMEKIPTGGVWDDIVQFLKRVWRRLTGQKGEPTLKNLKDVVRLMRNAMKRPEVPLGSFRLKDGGEVKLSMIAPTTGITPEMDAEYLAAVEAGDMATAQRMVDEAAKAAGFEIRVFRGDKDQSFTIFDAAKLGTNTANLTAELGFAFSPSEDVARYYAGGKTPKRMLLKGKVADLSLRDWDSILDTVYPTTGDINLYEEGKLSLQELLNKDRGKWEPIRQAIQDQMAADGATILRVEGDPTYRDKKADRSADQFFVTDPSQIKSADPVTYDDAGNVIPLSQRFQTASPDIRFSRPQFSSDTSAALSAGSEAARSTLYSERDMDIREAIRRAYEAMPKQNSVAVPIGELFAKTEELMPGVTQEEFSLVLQDLFEDNGAVLQEGEVVEPLTEQDRRYLALAEDEDANREELQRMVDEAAKRAGRRNESGAIVDLTSGEVIEESHRGVPISENWQDNVTFGERGKKEIISGERSIGITHTHPDESGLSDNDWKLLGWSNVKTIQAVTPSGAVFTVIKPPNVSAYPSQIEREWNKIEDSIFDSGLASEMDVPSIVNEINTRLAAVLGFRYSTQEPKINPLNLPAVTRDDQGRIIPLSRRFDTGADIRGQINVTTPEGRRAGFVVVMPRAAKASRIKAEDATEAAKTFQSDIIEAGKGRIDTASYQGNTLKSTEAPDHNENAPELYRDAAISLVDSLLSQGHSITDIADSFQDPEFRVAVGLLGNKAINPNVAQQAELFIGAEIQNRLENSFNKERNPAKKRIIEKTLKNHKAYYTVATGIGQNLNAVGALQQDPRFKWMFMFNEAEKEMADKAKDKLDTITGGGTQPVTDMVNQSEEAAADEATKQIEESVEEDEDAALFAEGEASLQGEAKSIWERMKDILRKIAFLDRLDKRDASSAKASLSEADKNTLSSLPKEERAKKRAEFVAEFIALGKIFMGEGKASDTPAQKATRQKRKKMVDTAKKRAEAGKSIDISDTESAVKIVLREMGKARPGKQVPLTKLMPWKDILAQKAKTVEEYRQRILDAMMASDAFKEVSDEDKAKIADIFAKQWDKKRTDILDRMLEREIERKRREGSLSEAAAKALQKSRNKIIELANLGGFDNDDLMKVLGEKFGIKTGFSEAEKARISELADKLQDETLNPAKRNKLAMEFAVTLAGASEIPVAEIIANWWTSSVLFGPQTIFSIGAAFVNGAYSITTIGTRRMLADLTRGDVKGAIEESILMLQGIAKYLGAFKQAGRRAWSYLWTGNVDVLGAAANDILGEINSLEELKRFKRHKLLAENLAKDPRALRRYVGMYLRFVNRLLTSLDAFNVMVTKAGTASLALRMSGMSTDNIIKAEKMLNLKAYKDQVIRDYFDNKAPKTQAEKALVDSYAEAEMYRAVDQLGGKMENADYLASESAMTMNPTGLGGFFYRSITGLDSKMKKAAEDYLEKAKKDWTTEKDLESTLFLGLAYLRQFAVQNLGGVAGYKFIRFASNKFNQGISYLPMVGLLRTLEAKGDDIKGKEAFIETIHRNQVIGAVLTLAAIAVVKALEDEPDDEERGNFWNGGWQNLTPDQKKQMLAKGQKEYTMGFKFNGRWYVFNYQNWPLNQVLAAIGSMSDQIRFSPKQWKEKGSLSKPLAGIVSGLKSTLEIPALSQLGTLVGNRLASKDPTEQTVDRISNLAAGWVGGFVPRILKDLDFATQPELRKYKTLWEKTASHIPIYRRYVGEDYYDILGQPIKRNVIPGSREFMMGPTEPEYKILGALNSRNIFLTPANAEYRMVGKGRNRRRLTQEEADAYSLETGKGYRQMLLRYGQRALQMPTERARAFLSDKADEVRDRALKKVYRR